MRFLTMLALTLILVSCQLGPVTPTLSLRLGTTTSTLDSGLMEAILPAFESQHNVEVIVVSGGTGEVLKFGANGDVDVVLVHSRAKEDKFVVNGDGVDRRDVMVNDFVVVGPTNDPAGVNGLAQAAEAFSRIAESQSPFASRGDDSGTHIKEVSTWQKLNLTPSPNSGWYFSLGQGQGETLNFANQKGAYALTDRGTWLSQQGNLPDLAIMVGGMNIAENQDQTLLNPYSVIPVNPAQHPNVNFDLATKFAEWITSIETQQMIAEYGGAQFGQPLFYPNSDSWKTAHP